MASQMPIDALLLEGARVSDPPWVAALLAGISGASALVLGILRLMTGKLAKEIAELRAAVGRLAEKHEASVDRLASEIWNSRTQGASKDVTAREWHSQILDRLSRVERQNDVTLDEIRRLKTGQHRTVGRESKP